MSYGSMRYGSNRYGSNSASLFRRFIAKIFKLISSPYSAKVKFSTIFYVKNVFSTSIFTNNFSVSTFIPTFKVTIYA